MSQSLIDVQLALVGEILMSKPLENLAESLFNNMVGPLPQSWEHILIA